MTTPDRAAQRIPARRAAILALLATRDLGGRRRPIAGRTRIQKLVFLTMTHADIKPDRTIELDFDFRPEQYGPADLNLYQDLEFLLASGLITREPSERTLEVMLDVPATGRGLAPEEMEEDDLSFEYLMGNEEEAAEFAAAEERSEVGYLITERGERLLDELIRQATGRHAEALASIRTAAAEVRREFGDWPLPKLLRYVYTEYPDMTTNSRIRRQVLGHD